MKKVLKWIVDVLLKWFVGIALGATVGAYLTAHFKNLEIKGIEERMKLNEGTYEWQVSSPEVRWTGDIDLESNGTVTGVDMSTIEICPTGAQLLPLFNYPSKIGKIIPESAGAIKVDIPVRLFRYQHCNVASAEDERLTGKLYQTIAYEGKIAYETKAGGKKGGMVLVKATPGTH